MDINNIAIKGLIVTVLVLIMLVPIHLVKSLIAEREENKEIVEDEITTKWGGKQHITGPILVLPFVEKGLDRNGVSTEKVKHAYFLPETLAINGEMNTEERSRTLYKALVYQSDLQFSGKFTFPDYSKLQLNKESIQWSEAFILINIPYLQGIKNKIIFNMNGKPLEIQPGIRKNDIIDSGITVKMPINPAEIATTYDFDFNLLLNGSDNLSFSPIGNETKITLKSNWETVSLIGNFLASERVMDDNGFSAKWDIFDYNRSFQQMWIGGNNEVMSIKVGADLRQPINQYQMSMRAIKYAVLFIALTFVVFFLVELLSKNKRIHPLQYLLVSFALILFYSLLIALSEHLGFRLSYLISAIAIIALISSYSVSIFKSKKQTLIMGGFLVLLYTYLYVILQLENMSLLIGSIGLFIALATIMYVSRKVDWYKLGEKNKTSEVSETPPIFIEEEKIDIYTEEKSENK